MCGICGVVRTRSGRPIDPAMLATMTDVIAHRGPDDAGVHVTADCRVGLGNRRLSIIDLSSAGHMPMANEDGSVWITYNGEIFNFGELRPGLEAKGFRFRSNTDTEVLLHAYEDRGLECFADFNGMFGVAIWDERERRLVLARDPFGIKPLYYAAGPDGQLSFASEVKSLIAGRLVAPEVDPEALHSYLNFLWVPGPKTLFKGIYKLQPGHYLVWHDGEHRVQRYANDVPSASNDHRSEADLVADLRDRLRAAVRRHMISDVPLGVFLSGGVDSSALLALGTEVANRPMKAFTIAYRAEDARAEQSNDDATYARAVAKQFGADHHVIELSADVVDLLPKIVYHLDEPVADPAAITSYLICKAARQDLTVLLSGQGGDEIFGGYRLHLADRLSRALTLVPTFVRDRILQPMWNTLPAIREYVPSVAPGKVMAFHRYGARLLRGARYSRSDRHISQFSYYTPEEQLAVYDPGFRARVAGLDPHAAHLRHFDAVKGAEFTNQMLYVDQQTFLPDLNLTYSDKTSMAASVEVRVPLLDQSVAALMRGIPGTWKVHGLKQKYLFKRAMEGILPHDVIWRGKAGFGAPIRMWLRRDLRDMVRDLLSRPAIAHRGYFDAREIQRMVDADASGAEDHAYRIWAFLTLELWHRTFIDGDVAA